MVWISPGTVWISATTERGPPGGVANDDESGNRSVLASVPDWEHERHSVADPRGQVDPVREPAADKIHGFVAALHGSGVGNLGAEVRRLVVAA